ncbi:hypothetical protein KVV02_006570 [Mortierella alpina]|uniref:Uncharacterized protein n=1 Tax=Mortierella alpina TaxID=64518 RepID=A0A9P8CZ80_MORAP|nr:hypothetical protein KVV02_006570 [Mortierella alpina]
MYDRRLLNATSIENDNVYIKGAPPPMTIPKLILLSSSLQLSHHQNNKETTMHISSGIIAAILLVVGVSASRPQDIRLKKGMWTVHQSIQLYPCASTCFSGWTCQEHPFAKQINACGGGSNWGPCRGFCVEKRKE